MHVKIINMNIMPHPNKHGANRYFPIENAFTGSQTLPYTDAKLWQLDENSCYKQNPSSYEKFILFQTLWIALQTCVCLQTCVSKNLCWKMNPQIMIRSSLPTIGALIVRFPERTLSSTELTLKLTFIYLIFHIFMHVKWMIKYLYLIFTWLLFLIILLL